MVPIDFMTTATSLGITISDQTAKTLDAFLILLYDANSKFNLTAVKTPEEAWQKHILDSLTLMPLLQGVDAQSVCDVGSGGGLPGIPLAIALPDISFTLLETTGKKARYLKETVETLKLDNVVVLQDRAESIGAYKSKHRDAYDVVTARAVGILPKLLELTVPMAKVGGFVFAIKGQKAETEINDSKRAMETLGVFATDVIETPTGRIVILEKDRLTPKKYPRQPGDIKHSPLT